MKSFWRQIPVNFYSECITYKPSRGVEAIALFNLYTIFLLDKRIIKGSFYFNHEEQKVLDAEIQIMQSGYEGEDVKKILCEIFGITSEKCFNILDKIEAKCYIRNLKRIEPIPPRIHNYFKVDLENIKF